MTRSKSRFLLVGIALLTFLSVIPIPGAGASAGAAAKPKEGGTLTYLAGDDSTTDLFPDNGNATIGVGGASGADARFAIYDALAIADSSGNLLMRIAESFKTTDGIVWTIKIRPNVKFSDGTPYDASAIKFNWTRMADPATKSVNLTLAQTIASIDVVDATTVRVTLKAANGSFSSTVATSPLTFIGSPTALQAKGASFATAPVGAGAYTLKEWVRNSSKTFVRNPTFYGTTYVDSIVFKHISDDTSRLNTLQSNGGDILYTTDLITANKAADTKSYRVDRAMPNGGYAMVFNVTKAPFNDVKARQAFLYAMNATEFNKAIFSGTSEAANTLFKKDSPYYAPKITYPSSNVKKAQALFDEIAAANGGKPLAVTITYPTSSITDRARWFQAYVASTFKNVNITLNEVSTPNYQVLGRAGTFDVIFGLLRFIDPNPGLRNSLGTNGPQNYAHYSSPDMDAALTKAAEASDPAVRKAAYNTVQELIAKDLPDVVFERLIVANAVTKSVQGFTTWADGIPRWDLIWKKSS